jgi:hypothetical protein
LVAGGGGSNGVLAAAELYDSENGSWTSATNMIEGRFGHAAAVLLDGRVLVVGGSDDFPPASAELYDPRSAP